MNSVGLFLMLGQISFSLIFLWGSEATGAGGAELLEQGERSNWIQRSGVARAGGAEQLEQGE
jgi:hypothetical protein